MQSEKTRPGVDCGSDHQLLMTKFRLKLKKVGITTRPFRLDPKQIPYDYTMEVKNKFKGLDLIECLKNYGQRFTTLSSIDQNHPTEKEMQEGKLVVWGGLTKSWEKKRNEGKGERERYTQLNVVLQRIARRDKKALLNEQCKETEENNRIGKTRDIFRNWRYQGKNLCKDGHNKGQKQYGPNSSRKI